MNVYITKLNGLPQQDTSQYIQRMTVEIGHQLGFREMGIYRYDGSGESKESLDSRLDGIIAGIDWGNDVVICQFPTGNGFKYEWGLINRLRMYRARITIFIHDFESLMYGAERSKIAEAVNLYNQAEVLIVPSYGMRQFLLDNGIKKDMKFVVQEMWDYVSNARLLYTPEFKREIHYTDEDGFEGIDRWNYVAPLNVYAHSAAQGQNVKQIEGLGEEEWLFKLSKGGFGLVWYKNEEERKYMEYSVSFSLSRYLVAGIPVIVPMGISNQTLIEVNHLGVAVNSLDEAVAVVESMDESEYQGYIQSVGQFAPVLRNGYYAKRYLTEAVQAFYRKDACKISAPAKIYGLGDYAFRSAVLKESYGGNLVLSWSFQGEPDGFILYDITGTWIYETRNVYQHYFLIKEWDRDSGFIVKAFIDTLKGKLVVAESETICLQEEKYEYAKVSLIMPACNAEDYIVRSIDTALAQSFSNLEVIIVDDGSVDSTSDIIDWYAEKYPSVIAIHQKSGGPAVARNTGIRHANGEYIGFMDSDDMIHPDMVSRLYYSAVKNGCDIAITSAYRIDDNGYTVLIHYPLEEDTAIAIEDFFWIYFHTNIAMVAVWNKLYRASLVKEHLFPELFLGEDGAWTPYILSYADKICYLNGCLYEYDRVVCKSPLMRQWGASQTKEERFAIHKNMVTFYLKNGNLKRLNLLKVMAKWSLIGWKQTYAYDEYETLWHQIEEKLNAEQL